MSFKTKRNTTRTLTTTAVAGLAALCLFSLSACSSKAAAAHSNGANAENASISGSVSTNGSTSMEKVIGGLSEKFMAENSQVKITYDATGSGTDIESASNGSADIGLSSRELKPEEQEKALKQRLSLWTVSRSSYPRKRR